MKIHKNVQIEKAASNDDTRKILCNPWLDGSNLVATNGRILAVIPIEKSDHDTDGIIPSAALKEARKIKQDQVEINANGCVTYSNKNGSFTLEREKDVTFPNYKQLIVNANDHKKYIKIALDVDLLINLAAALGGKNDQVNIEIPLNEEGLPLNHAFKVTPLIPSQAGAFGLLMPCRIS